MEEAQRGRGRPRDPEKDEAIRDATWSVLATKGYDNLTFEAVAQLANVSRTTLYRRFASKPDLVGSVLFETARAMERALPVETEPRALLRMHVRSTAAYMSGERGRALLNIIECSPRVPDLANAVARATGGDQALYMAMLRNLRPDASDEAIALAFDMLIGAIILRVAIGQQPFAPEALEALVDAAIVILNTGI